MSGRPLQAVKGRPAAQIRTAIRQMGRPHGKDVVAGLVTGMISIPEGMAYANIGGFDPAAGLYSGMLPTLLSSVFTRTVLMVTTLTSAMALRPQAARILDRSGLTALIGPENVIPAHRGSLRRFEPGDDRSA